MPGLKDLSLIWQNIREVDLRPIRDAALLEVKIGLVGEPGAGRHTLADQMRLDPARAGVQTRTPMAIVPLNDAEKVGGADLIIVMVDATRSEYQREQALVGAWTDKGKKVLVFFNKYDLLQEGQVVGQWVGWQAAKVLYGSALDVDFLKREFVPAVLELVPAERYMALGRQFPIFRIPIARDLIGDTCFSNTAYAVSTGVAEIVPVLDLPLNVTDMIILTKSQAFLAYRLGLLLGFSTRWQDYVAEFGSVIGGGFIWRQLARSLVGLIPVWGIVPKVAVSYAGTYVVGNAVLQWYLTGRHLSAGQLRGLYLQAFARGKEFARKTFKRSPRQPRLDSRKVKSLPAGSTQAPPATVVTPVIQPAAPEADLSIADTQPVTVAVVEPRPSHDVSPQTPPEPPVEKKKGWFSKKTVSKPQTSAATKPRRGWGRKQPLQSKACPKCGKDNALDANFCQYCANSFDTLAENR